MGSDVGHGVPETLVSMEDSRRGRWRREKKGGILLQGYVEEEEEEEEMQDEEEEEEEGSGSDCPKDDGVKRFSRTRSLTDDDLDELKGCVDLGFGFSYEEIPELCNTLPALELCYSMSQRFMDEQQQGSPSPDSSSSPSEGGSHIANWKISSPGDHPEEVKARLKFWAQAVACTVKLCTSQSRPRDVSTAQVHWGASIYKFFQYVVQSFAARSSNYGSPGIKKETGRRMKKSYRSELYWEKDKYFCSTASLRRRFMNE